MVERPCRYLTAEDMNDPHRSTDRAKTSEQTLPQRFAQQHTLNSPDDFTVPSIVFGEQQAKAIGRPLYYTEPAHGDSESCLS